jgi:hypothetical protein
MLLNNIVPMASINPWSMDASENSGTSYHQNVSSRAAAYGIAFENSNISGGSYHQHHYHPRYTPFHNDTDDSNDRDDTNRSFESHIDNNINNNVGAVPLLTPSTIVTSNFSNPEYDDRNQYYQRHHHFHPHRNTNNAGENRTIHGDPTVTTTTTTTTTNTHISSLYNNTAAAADDDGGSGDVDHGGGGGHFQN